MKNNPRREKIENLIIERGGISVRELVESFEVSRMTIHRDLLQLEREGKVARLRGGAIPVGSRNQPKCTSCGRALIPHQQVAGYCCAHCALMNCPDPALLIFRDFISGQHLPAEDSYFLLNTMVDICCRPAILAFAREADVVNFRLGFGGVVGRLKEAVDFLQLERKLAGNSLNR